MGVMARPTEKKNRQIQFSNDNAVRNSVTKGAVVELLNA
jgi:hypothetical protein